MDKHKHNTTPKKKNNSKDNSALKTTKTVKTSKKSTKTSNKPKIFVIVAAIVIVLAIAAFIIAHFIINSVHRCNGLLGSWRYSGTDYSGEYIMTFNGNGTGTYYQDGDTLDFEYADLGDTFDIIYDGQDITGNFAYTVSEDNSTFTLVDSLGEDVVYTCE